MYHLSLHPTPKSPKHNKIMKSKHQHTVNQTQFQHTQNHCWEANYNITYITAFVSCSTSSGLDGPLTQMSHITNPCQGSWTFGIFIIPSGQFSQSHTPEPRSHAPQTLCPQNCQMPITPFVSLRICHQTQRRRWEMRQIASSVNSKEGRMGLPADCNCCQTNTSNVIIIVWEYNPTMLHF